ncbi:MAG: pteridine reductase [Gammaproteobacteria bacterium]|nr:MAG: pteridine reductase [Gammaproteobacteria bacterium]
MNHSRVALITGGAQRIGACIAETLHQQGWRVLVHCRHSADTAKALADRLNQQRADSAQVLVADLDDHPQTLALARQALAQWQRVDLLVNNASAFYPTPLAEVTEEDWHTLMASNLKAPLFLSQQLASALARHNGSIINLIDIHAQKPLPRHSVYCAAKAGLAMLTQSLAIELAPAVRVNGIAPGAILWPPGVTPDTDTETRWLSGIPLARKGQPEDIANAVSFLANAPYITGQILAVDGGKSLTR